MKVYDKKAVKKYVFSINGQRIDQINKFLHLGGRNIIEIQLTRHAAGEKNVTWSYRWEVFHPILKMLFMNTCFFFSNGFFELKKEVDGRI